MLRNEAGYEADRSLNQRSIASEHLPYYRNAFKSEEIQWIESEPGIDGVIIIEAFSLEKHYSQ